ncbi:DMT family transporter [Candidatus Pseudothioglobus singularis]|jgi:drug/metabolite transporter (DMT)-like permease|uniref:Transporter n=1 Tax=Candidatus Pseudothioglobus singularis PS1 TaxID=1125411 RepID=A0A0M5KRN3_9GAMM|nr:DMT family transporter [Candidatus Pseudothioglobus singularis]ALE01653.1 transporter [Candidatus Pseudothioglobus singularis PS1]
MNALLYFVVLLAWGSSWFAISFQLGDVAPQVSIVWRFLLASIILFIWCYFRGLKLSFPWRDHLSWLLLGFFLFCVNYICAYFGTFYLASGLICLIFSTLTLFTVFNGFVFFKKPIRLPILIGAVVGIAGLSVIFSNEISSTDWSLESGVVKGFLWMLFATFFASIGMLLSGQFQARKMPLVQSNAFSMLYGSLILVFYITVSDVSFSFNTSYSYVISLVYLALIASVIGFGFYLKLVGNIGADKASYVNIFTPTIALLLSTLFENYEWSWIGLIGVLLIIIGNIIVLYAKPAN